MQRIGRLVGLALVFALSSAFWVLAYRKGPAAFGFLLTRIFG